MSDNKQALPKHRLLKWMACILLGLVLLAGIGYSQSQTVVNLQQAILQGSIQIQPLKVVSGDQIGKIQAGTAVKLVVTVENKGQEASPPGQIYVRYAFAHPLDHEVTSVIFETEKQLLPSIEPDKKIEIAFDASHQIPSLLDFVRYDWSMREYQAMAIVNHEEYLLGTLAITFSAYYYPGIKKELSTKISPVERQ